jgi:hypothetical protein
VWEIKRRARELVQDQSTRENAMIIWGSGGGGGDLGEVEQRQCLTCEKVRSFKLLLQYRYAHIYWLRWVTSRKYFVACDVCQRGSEVEESAVKPHLTADPIPFMTRFGWAFLVGGIALIFLLVSLGD